MSRVDPVRPTGSAVPPGPSTPATPRRALTLIPTTPSLSTTSDGADATPADGTAEVTARFGVPKMDGPSRAKKVDRSLERVAVGGDMGMSLGVTGTAMRLARMDPEHVQ